MKNASTENRLAKEKSPYLLQHARNPVNWFPWGKEAFELAQKENKPIFLSIGYSTCHWCHVMERESFEDEAIAALLNRDFVSIKVDREERPDIDHIYMTFVQGLTGAGGWPLTAFLTPDGKPFTGATYIPPEDRWGRLGMKNLLPRIADLWKQKGNQVREEANHITQFLQPQIPNKSEGQLSAEIMHTAFHQFESNYDPEYGGFGDSPKFPRSHDLSFLLRFWHRDKTHASALEMVEKTLRQMALSGMYDQIGGGFHRYSTDREWLVPHFEKMLYDQAILVRTYIEAYQVTKNHFYLAIAEDILNYVLRDMTAPEGGFLSAEDADSEGEEGLFYVWRPEEIAQILGPDKGALINDYYGVTDSGNFEHGRSILFCPHSPEEFASQKKLKSKEFVTILSDCRKMLFEYRAKRIHPHKDDKVLTAWNGLMISSLAAAAQVTNKHHYVEAAEKSAKFILSKMQQNGRLLRRYRDGEVSILGFQDDYAFFATALLDLYETTFDPTWLEEAVKMTSEMIRLFWDSQGSGFFYMACDAEELIAKTKEYYDGAVPSANSVAVRLLLRLSRMTGDAMWESYAEQTLKSNLQSLMTQSVAYPEMLMALDFSLGPSYEIVLAGNTSDSNFQSMLNEIHQNFLPRKVVIHSPVSQVLIERMTKWMPFIHNQKMIEGKTTAYVCHNHRCDLPLTDPSALTASLRKIQ